MTTGPLILDAGGATKAIELLQKTLTDTAPIFRAIAGALEAETDRNFEAQGRPAWVPLSAATMAERKKRNHGSTVLMILQDSGNLKKSISSDYGADYALIGAGGAASAYAGVQQFGATITHPAYSTKVRLRTDAKGNLLRQGDEGKAKNLAVFAKDSHKRVRESWHEVGQYTVVIPPRPYLPFFGSAENATLQPEAAQSVLDVVERALAAAAG